MKKYFSFFVYISLVFLVYALYKADYLKMPVIQSFTNIFISIGLLFAGFLIDAYCWKKTLDIMGYKTTFRNAIVSNGLSVFGKYIPGKIWLIAGRSMYVAKKKSYPESEVITVSVITQIIILWIGVIYGIIGLFLINSIRVYGIIGIAFLLVLSLVLFSKYPHHLFVYSFKKIFKKDIKIPFIKLNQIIKILIWPILRWGLYSLSFYFLLKGLHVEDIPIYLGLAYPLAGTLGIAVVIAPGGLGVREGILTALLASSIFSLESATTISITSRMWFLLGEIFIFLMGLLISKIIKNNKIKLPHK